LFSQIIPLAPFSEPFSSLSHFIGAAAFAILGAMLLARGRGNTARMAALAVYVGSLVITFTLSGVFHLVPRGTPEHVLAGRLDYASIFLLIAGSFTPPHVILFRGPGRWGMLLFIWSVALAGIIVKTLHFDMISHAQSVVLYLAMGWSGLVSAWSVWRRFGFGFTQPLLAGAAAYTIGAFCELSGSNLTLWSGVIEGHEIWHLAVLLGAMFHWSFIYQFADGTTPPLRQGNANPFDRDESLAAGEEARP